jgi:hypothetical protein
MGSAWLISATRDLGPASGGLYLIYSGASLSLLALLVAEVARA